MSSFIDIASDPRANAAAMGHLSSFARRRAGVVAVLGSAFILGGCGGSGPQGVGPEADQGGGIVAVGSPTTLDLGTWNLEWFGDPGNGPENERLQLANIGRVLDGLELDVVGVQEVVGEEAFAELVAGLPGYSGVLANDPRVEGGATYYSDFGDNEQKVGLIYNDSVAELVSAKVILAEYDHAFAGRPPLEAEFRLLPEGLDLFVIVLHAKAGSGAEDYQRRSAASAALKAYLDAQPTRPVAVLGDFNDDMDVSIFEGSPSPYLPFVVDSVRYAVPTAEISRSGRSSTVNYSDVVDHHLVTDELWSAYLAGSANALRLDADIAGWGDTTSDHYPVISRYRM